MILNRLNLKPVAFLIQTNWNKTIIPILRFHFSWFGGGSNRVFFQLNNDI